jgi:hypothetical protein
MSDRLLAMPLAAQLGNLGSEFSRAMKWQGKDDAIFWSEVSRFLDYLNSMILQPGLFLQDYV